jgi:mannose-6-phosphate isomerase class I
MKPAQEAAETLRRTAALGTSAQARSALESHPDDAAKMLEALMGLELGRELEAYVARLRKQPQEDRGKLEYWILKAHETFGPDRGIWAMHFLNLVRLVPGQALSSRRGAALVP